MKAFNSKSLSALEKIYPEMTIRQLRILLWIAENPSCLMVDVVRGTNLPQSVCSRTIRSFLLDAVNSKNLGLIDQSSHPTDGRKKLLTVTNKFNEIIDCNITR